MAIIMYILYFNKITRKINKIKWKQESIGIIFFLLLSPQITDLFWNNGEGNIKKPKKHEYEIKTKGG